MARRRGSIQQGTALLTTFRGGVNRNSAVGDQLRKGLDVWAKNINIERRPAWKSIAHGVPYLLPPGRTILKASNDGVSFSTLSDRKPVGVLTRKYWYIGCTEPFDGFVWPSRWTREIGPTDSFTASHTLVVYANYGVTNYFTPAVDTTVRFSGGHKVPLIGRGSVSWHRDSETWGTSTVDGVTAYWARVSLAQPDGVLTSFTPHLEAPGVQAFHLAPVNGLIQSKVRGRRTRLVGSSRYPTRGFEKGAELGELRSEALGVQRVWYAVDEGPGVYDVDSFSYGTTGRLTKDRTTTPEDVSIPYAWIAGQHQGSQLVSRKDNSAEQGVDATAATASTVTFAETVTDRGDNYFEHARVRVTRNASGGASVGYERAVVSSNGTTGALTFDGTFDSTPNTGNDFVVTEPHMRLSVLSKVLSEGSGHVLDTFEVYKTYAGHTLSLVGESAETAGVTYAEALPDLDGLPIYWMLAKELRWALPSGTQWDAAYEPNSDNVLLTNGSTILRFDGVKVRPFEAASDDDPGLLEAAGWVDSTLGANSSENPALGRALENIRGVPTGVHAIRVWQQRLFAFGRRRFWWSVPGQFTWWLGSSEGAIPEDARGDIRGVATLGDRLVLFTANSLFELVPVGSRFAVRGVSYTIGFTSNAAVKNVVANGLGMLLGPTPWGVAMWNGGEPAVLLDAWTRLLEEPPTQSDLLRACAAVSHQLGMYFLGIGDRVLIYEWAQRRWWVWSIPWGVRSMMVDVNNGFERLLVGTADGHVVTLQEGTLEDDGVEAINAVARCGDHTPNASGEVAVYRGLVNLRESLTSLAVKLHVDARESTQQSVALYSKTQRPTWGTAWGTLKWAEPEERTVDFGVRNGTRCEKLAVSISGSGLFSVREVEVLGRAMARRARGS